MFSLIVAASKNDVIGINNDLPFHIPEDLKRFKCLTEYKTIIMGRKTFESLPRVLSNRTHIVITSNKNIKSENPNVIYVNSIDEVIKKYSNTNAFVIGGGQIYKEFLQRNLINKIYLTRVNEVIKNGDTFFPKIPNNFKLVKEEIYSNFSFLDYEKYE